MDLNFLPIKQAAENIQKYSDSIDTILETLEESYSYAVLTYDMELLRELKESVSEITALLTKYINEQDQKYEHFIRMFKMLGMIHDETEILVLQWDFKRPIIYRIQRLNELLKSINEVIT